MKLLLRCRKAPAASTTSHVSWFANRFGRSICRSQRKLGPASATANRRRRSAPADTRSNQRNFRGKRGDTAMVWRAASNNQSNYCKAQDKTAEKKLKIKAVTEEEIGVGKDKEKKLVVWFTNDPRGLVLNRVNNRTLRGTFGDP